MISKRDFVRRNFVIIKKYLQENYHYKDHREIYQLFLHEPELAYRIIEDYKKKNEDKIIDLLYEFLESNYYVGVVFGDPGQGKTSFALWFLYQAWLMSEKKLKIYNFGSFLKPFFFEGIVFDLNQVPPNSVVYFDELGKAFPARSFMNQENQKLQQHLIDLRHFDIKYFGCTQRARLVDVTYFQFAYYKFFKYVTPDTLALERAEIVTPLISFMLPKDPNDKSLVLASTRNFLSTFRYFLPEWWNEKMSKNISQITEENLIEYAKYLLSLDYSPREVQKILATRYRFSKSLEYYERLKSLI